MPQPRKIKLTSEQAARALELPKELVGPMIEAYDWELHMVPKSGRRAEDDTQPMPAATEPERQVIHSAFIGSSALDRLTLDTPDWANGTPVQRRARAAVESAERQRNRAKITAGQDALKLLAEQLNTAAAEADAKYLRDRFSHAAELLQEA